ncbi:GntR family transcriptional regulator [Thermophilibacter provencensis]|uniref:GntR family transcriptional regulator n=1 Tax=Thermophilibacter provencensis TaxID=1852386 RepID=A0A921GEA9_9ACTN|nr:GntR family transcriptional regulator [Thermophilibacter provencensis]MBM6814652.1 GntR family transcriptional regulator [Olsenella uli]HJF44660.1 GntR family transcriptional regulator [Thermophilibacter provencensis]
MEIIISNASNKPIYEQITDQVKAAILAGELAEGEQLPSIRTLASSLRVSVITTKRAYTDLEAAGFIETVQGKGSFVAGGNMELIREERMRGVESLLMRAIADGRAAGLSDGELKEMFNLLMESDD